jgi:pimeloyl-ACP methyl ester carboxylesterase
MTFETARGSFEYIDAGSGAPVLYFHGTGAGNDLALIMEQSLLDQGFRLVIPNRPGYFNTSIACGRTTADTVRLADHLLDFLRISRVGVIGTSGGGPAAIAFASTFADRTSALVLQCAQSHRWTSPEWLPDGKSWILPFLRMHSTKRVIQLANHLQTRCLPWMAKSYLKALTGRRYAELKNDPVTHQLCSAMIEFEVECILRPAGIDNDLDILLNEPIAESADVRCPSLIIHDRFDPVVPIAHAHWAQRHIPQAEICEVEAGGHLIWVGRDDAMMFERRQDFLRNNVAA